MVWEGILRFMRRRPRILFALLVILLMCWFHCKSDVIVSHKYLAESVSDKFWLRRVYKCTSLCFGRPTLKMKHLSILNCICHMNSHSAILFKSFCRGIVSHRQTASATVPGRDSCQGPVLLTSRHSLVGVPVRASISESVPASHAVTWPPLYMFVWWEVLLT